MRYNVHPPHAFRHRIAKSIGVLVAAALIADTGAAHCGPGTKRSPRSQSPMARFHVKRRSPWSTWNLRTSTSARWFQPLDRDPNRARYWTMSWLSPMPS